MTLSWGGSAPVGALLPAVLPCRRGLQAIEGVRVLRWLAVNGRRALVFLAGAVLCLLGAAMLVLPGPGLLTLAAGLALLSIEFAWARSLLQRCREELHRRTGRLPPHAPPRAPEPGR